MKQSTEQKQGLVARYHNGQSATDICAQAGISRSTFYNYLYRNKKEESNYQFRRTELSEQIIQVYEESNQIYGAKKIKAVLASRSVAVSDKWS